MIEENQTQPEIFSLIEKASNYDLTGQGINPILTTQQEVNRRYDTFLPNTDMEDMYAQRQSGFDLFKNSIGQLVSLGAFTFTNHFAGYGRSISATFNDEVVNPDLDLAYSIRDIQDAFPIFETKEAREKKEQGGIAEAFAQYIPFTDGSGTAYANLFGQFGFTLGTASAVIGESLVIAAITRGAGSGKTIQNIKNTLKAPSYKSIMKMVREEKDISKIRTLSKQPSAVGSILNSPIITTYRMAQAAKGEGWIEGQSARLDYIEEQLERIGDGITPELFKEVDKRSLEVAGGVASMNTPIIMASNLFTIGGLFKPKNFSKIPVLTDIPTRELIKKSTLLTERGLINKTLKEYPKVAKGLSVLNFVTGKGLPEGLEEFFQGVASRYAISHYDMLNEDVAKGFTAQLVGISKEIGHSLESREAWDEFASGVMTGMLMSGGSAGYSAYRNRGQKERVQAAVESLSSFNSSYMNSLKQVLLAEKQQVANDEGNIREAKNLKNEQEIALIEHLNQYGVFDNYIDNLADFLTEAAKENPQEFGVFTEQNNVSRVVSSLKEKNEKYTELFNNLSKNVKNPFSKSEKNYAIYEAVKRKAVNIHMMAEDSLNRAKSLQQEISTKFSKIDATILNALADPETLFEAIPLLKERIQVNKDSLSIEGLPALQKEKYKKELKIAEDKLKVLEKIEKDLESVDEKTRDSIIALIIKNAFGNEDAAPKEVKQALKDISELEAEGREYLTIFNALQNAETFEKFAKSFTDGYELRIRQAKERIDKASAEVLPTTPKEQSKQETENSAVKNFLDRVTYNPDTEKFVVDNVPFDTIEEAAASEGITDDILNEVNTNGKTNREVINQTDYAESLLDEEESLNPQATNTSLKEEKSKVDGMSEEELVKKVTFEDEPKKKSKSEETFFNFIASKGHTILHNFSVAIGFPITYNNLEKKAEKIGDLELISRLKEAIEEMNGDFFITNISLVKERDDWNINDEDIKVIHDGIRYFIVTKGNKADSIGIIQEKLKIKISPNKNSSLVINENGDYLQSDFLDNDKKEERAKSIAKVKVGTKLQVIVADTQFNIDLKQEYENSEKKEQDKEKYLSKVELAITSIDDVNDIYGTLRAGDFLYLNDVEEEYIKQIRTSNLFETGIGQIVVGLEAIAKTHKNTRGFNYNGNGELQYLTLTDFEKQRGGGVKTEYFLVDDNGDIYNEKQVKTDSKDLTNRTTLSKGAIYMKVTDRNGAIEVSQVFKGVEGNDKFTIEEFTNQSFKDNATTNVSPTTPIASQRLEVKIQQASNTFNTSIVDDIEDIVEEFEEVIEEEVVEDTTESDIKKINEEVYEIDNKIINLVMTVFEKLNDGKRFLTDDFASKLDDVFSKYRFIIGYEKVENAVGMVREGFVNKTLRPLLEDEFFRKNNKRVRDNIGTEIEEAKQLLKEREKVKNKLSEVLKYKEQSTTQSDIEAKKAEIEKLKRDKQEELTTLKVGDSYDVISSTNSFDGTWTVVEITDKFYRLIDDKGGKLNMGKSRVEENLKRPDGVTETKYRKSNRNEISAKYGAEIAQKQAELKALEQQETITPTTQSTSTTQSEIEVETKEVEELSKEEAVKEIQSKNLTHVRGLGMSAQQASGTYISTEGQNRYATEENRAERVFVNITSPLVVSNDTGLVSKRNEILNQQKSKFSAEDSFTYEEFGNKKLTVDDLNEQGLEKLAILVTESLIEEGYDSIYFPETSTQEGELVVFYRENIQFEDDYNQEEAELLEGGAKKRREAGYFDSNGIRYERQVEDNDSPKGNKGSVKFADKLSVPYTYELREDKKVQPSHKNGALNNLHFIPEAQPKDRRTKDSVIQIKQIADNPNLLEAGESPIAYSGAPIINKRGEVIQGNNRAQGIVKHYAEQGKQYKQQLTENAEKFGFTKEQVEAMENPVLVRVVNATDADAIKLGNYDSADIESAGSGRLDIDKLDKRIATEDKSRLLDAVFKDSDTDTINSSIRTNINKIYQILEPYLNLSQKNSIFGKSSVSQETINDLEKLFQKFLFINTSTLFDTAFGNLPTNVQKGIHKSAALLLRVPKNKSIIKDLQNAIIANYNFSKSGVDNAVEWLNQGSLFGEKAPRDKYTPLEIELFKIIQDTSRIEDMSKPLMDYARATASTPRTLFEEAKEGLSREEAVKKVFNVDYTKTIALETEDSSTKENNNITKKQTKNSPEVKIESNGENTKASKNQATYTSYEGGEGTKVEKTGTITNVTYKENGNIDTVELLFENGETKTVKNYSENFSPYSLKFEKDALPLRESMEATQTTNALRDVESTAKALEDLPTDAKMEYIQVIELALTPIMGNELLISEAYHKAKADDSNHELVKAVESLLSKEQPQKTPTPKIKTKKLFRTTSSITVEVDNINVNIPQGTVYDKEKGVLKVNNVDIKVEDITKVVDNQQATTETPSQETETPLEETTFQNLTESKEIFEYLKNNAIIGQPLTNVAGDTFTLLEEKDDTKLIRVKDKQGEFYIAIKGNQVQKVSFDNDFFAAFETIFDILPIDQREELTPDSIVESFNRAASKYAPNLGESILIALREAYVQSVKSGRPTINLGALVELSDMTEDEKNIFNSLLSSSFHASIVRYITKSEVIYNIDANRKWNAVRNELGMSAEYLELSDPSITPAAKYENAVGNKMGQIENLLNSIGIKLSLPKTFINNETKQAITNSLKAAIDKDTYKEAYKEVKKGLIDTGIKVTNTASKLREVADNLLGYDLEQDYINTFSRQLEEMRNGKVADSSGVYVEVEKLGTLNTSLPIITTTKQVLKDKGIELSLDVIAASLKVNGKLNPLMIAVNKHLKALERKDAKEITVVRGGQGFIVTKTKKEIIKYNGQNYLPFGTDYEGNIVYYNPSNSNAYENITAKVTLQNKQTNGVEVSKQNFNNERIKNKTNNKTC